MARSVAEIEADLADVRAAIKRVLTNQSYGTGDTRVERARLSELQALKKDYEAELAAAQDAALGSAGGIAFNTGRYSRQ